MNHTRHELAPGLHLDARRAAFLEPESVLAVADLHLGYAWTHRARGQMLPLSAPDDTIKRLYALLDDYQPKTLALLGDIVHGVVHVEAVRDEVSAILAALGARTTLALIAGNHDRHLRQIVAAPLLTEFRPGPHLLLHGDLPDEATAASHLANLQAGGGRIFMGHEHPAISLGDGVAHHVRVPCFLVTDELVVLPAFSDWAAGTNVRSRDFLSPLTRRAEPSRAVAILAGKLLPVGF